MAGISERRKPYYRQREVLHKPLHNAARYLSKGGLSCGLSAARPGAPRSHLGLKQKGGIQQKPAKPGLKGKSLLYKKKKNN